MENNFIDINKYNEVPPLSNNDMLQINDLIDDDNDRELESELYEQVFNVASNIFLEITEKQKQLTFIKMIQMIIHNIVEKTLLKEDSEKYRRLKLSNVNIMKLFEIPNVYEFITYIGFTEKAIDNELFLYLEESKADDERLMVILSYLNLLILNEEEAINYYEEGSLKYDDIGMSMMNECNEQQGQIPKNYYKKAGIVDILKASKDVRLGNTLILPQDYDKKLCVESLPQQKNLSSNINSNPIPDTNQVKQIAIMNPYYQKKDIKTILKETANVRKENANRSEYIPNESFNQIIPNNSNPYPQTNSNNKPREMSLIDLQYSNPDLHNPSKIKEEIGKKCLELTNEFRQKNNLPFLAWDDSVWKIAYEHSQNMGNHIVKFGHDGFNERIKKIPFYSSLTCENVFMCLGISQYDIASMAVNGWINSPGHRKNMLTYTSHCAIAAHRNGYGEYFLTQIFVKKW